MEGYSIWEKDEQQIPCMENCLMEYVLLKQSKKQIEIKRLFKFYDNCILQYKDQTYQKYVGKLEINFDLRIEWIFEKKFSETEEPTPIIGLIFKRGTKEVAYKSQNKQEILRIYNCLRRKVNQCNISDFYKAVKKIGTGGFANVYILENRVTGQQFASKTFIKAKLKEKEYGRVKFAALIQEIKILRSLCHPNIIQLQEMFETDNSYYMLTELLQGGNLLKYIKNQKQLKESQVSFWVQQLLPALQLLKQVQILHRDIKPENLMFQDQFEPQEYKKAKLVFVDFGLATKSPVVAGKGELFIKCGTPGFVAPEICNLKEEDSYDEKCDLFSLGCVIHILQENSIIDLINQQAFKQTRILSSIIQ